MNGQQPTNPLHRFSSLRQRRLAVPELTHNTRIFRIETKQFKTIPSFKPPVIEQLDHHPCQGTSGFWRVNIYGHGPSLTNPSLSVSKTHQPSSMWILTWLPLRIGPSVIVWPKICLNRGSGLSPSRRLSNQKIPPKGSD